MVCVCVLKLQKSKITEFHKYVINMRKKLCFEIGQLGNMDEVPLNFDVPSNKTMDVNLLATEFGI